MGLIAHIRHRSNVWAWRVRYWWFDTPAGEYLRWSLVFLGAFVALAEMSRFYIDATTARATGQPEKAIYWWVVQLIIAIVAAAVSYALRPRPQAPKPVKGEAPITDDGQAIVHCFGECWIDDEFLLAWKLVGKEKIQVKSGK